MKSRLIWYHIKKSKHFIYHGNYRIESLFIVYKCLTISDKLLIGQEFC